MLMLFVITQGKRSKQHTNRSHTIRTAREVCDGFVTENSTLKAPTCFDVNLIWNIYIYIERGGERYIHSPSLCTKRDAIVGIDFHWNKQRVPMAWKWGIFTQRQEASFRSQNREKFSDFIRDLEQIHTHTQSHTYTHIQFDFNRISDYSIIYWTFWWCLRSYRCRRHRQRHHRCCCLCRSWLWSSLFLLLLVPIDKVPLYGSTLQQIYYDIAARRNHTRNNHRKSFKLRWIRLIIIKKISLAYYMRKIIGHEVKFAMKTNESTFVSDRCLWLIKTKDALAILSYFWVSRCFEAGWIIEYSFFYLEFLEKFRVSESSKRLIRSIDQKVRFAHIFTKAVLKNSLWLVLSDSKILTLQALFQVSVDMY